MSLENDSLHFNCAFKFTSIDEVIYLSFVSDAEKDENAKSRSAVLLPLFHKGLFFDTYRGKPEFTGFSINVKKPNDSDQERTLLIFISNISTENDVLLHTVKIPRTIGIEWHMIPYESDITSAFNKGLLTFLHGESYHEQSKNDKWMAAKNEVKKLSNTKFACGLLVILAVFLIIFNSMNSHDADSNNLEPVRTLTSASISHDENPTIKAVSVQNDGVAPVSSSGESLTDYLKSAPSNAQVEKSLTTSFQDADSVKQQVDLNKQVLKNLGLPQGSDNDTGCFTGG